MELVYDFDSLLMTKNRGCIKLIQSTKDSACNEDLSDDWLSSRNSKPCGWPAVRQSSKLPVAMRCAHKSPKTQKINSRIRFWIFACSVPHWILNATRQAINENGEPRRPLNWILSPFQTASQCTLDELQAVVAFKDLLMPFSSFRWIHRVWVANLKRLHGILQIRKNHKNIQLTKITGSQVVRLNCAHDA